MKHAIYLTLFLLVAAACSDPADTPTTRYEFTPVDVGPDLGPADTGAPDADDATADTPDLPEQSALPTAWTVHISADADAPVQWTAADVARYLGEMGGTATVENSEGSCQPGQGAIVFAAEPIAEAPSPQTFSIAEQRCDGGVLVTLAGGGLLGRQYAGYEFLHTIGVRFFHPEQEYVPERPQWPATPLSREHTPDFRLRSVSLHLTHPLELGDAFRNRDEALEPEAVRYIDWQLKNLASNGHAGIGTGENQRRGIDRGFPVNSGFSLHNQQQGGRAVYDPDDPRPMEEQIGAAIDERMAAAHRTPDMFSFTFNPSEFTELDDEFVVRELTFIADYIGENYPDTEIYATNHGTHGEPTENYGVRYYDLPQFAPPNLGVKVHTLMFFDVFRPAPVYGNEDFNYLYDFMVQEHQIRNLIYFPESAWWLTFDIPVPLYLPITIEARDVDIQGMKHMLDGKLVGHRTFGSGHEWGYWQNEYCSLRLAADVDYSYRDCLRDIATPTGDAAEVVVDVLERVIRYQERDIVYGDLIAYLAGSDPETEVAALAGIHFHALPPAVPAIAGWSEDEIRDWRARIEPALIQMDKDYEAEVARLDAVRSLVPERGMPWFDEILDGIEVTGLRARHALHVYGALVTLRESQLRDDADLARSARRQLEAARADTAAALEVIHRREEQYRYKPLDRAIGGGPDGSQDENWTVYRYRYLNRTHHAYYYTRIDRLAEQAFDGGVQAIDVPDALIGPGQELAVDVVDPGADDAQVDWGDGSTESGRRLRHTYDAPGIYALVATTSQGDEEVEIAGDIAQLTQEVSTGFTGSTEEPSAAALIDSLLPAIVLGRIDDERMAVGFDVAGQGLVGLGGWQQLSAADAQSLVSEPQDVVVPIVNRATREAITTLTVNDGVFTVDAESLTVTGDLPTMDVVNALVEIGGFEPDGARRLVASTLGFTPETLPETVPFRIRWQLN